MAELTLAVAAILEQHESVHAESPSVLFALGLSIATLLIFFELEHLLEVEPESISIGEQLIRPLGLFVGVWLEVIWSATAKFLKVAYVGHNILLIARY